MQQIRESCKRQESCGFVIKEMQLEIEGLSVLQICSKVLSKCFRFRSKCLTQLQESRKIDKVEETEEADPKLNPHKVETTDLELPGNLKEGIIGAIAGVVTGFVVQVESSIRGSHEVHKGR